MFQPCSNLQEGVGTHFFVSNQWINLKCSNVPTFYPISNSLYALCIVPCPSSHLDVAAPPTHVENQKRLERWNIGIYRIVFKQKNMFQRGWNKVGTFAEVGASGATIACNARCDARRSRYSSVPIRRVSDMRKPASDRRASIGLVLMQWRAARFR